MRTTSVVERNDAAVRRGELVGAQSECPTKRPRHRNEESAGRALVCRGLRDRRIGAVVPCCPAVRSRLATLHGKYADATQTEFPAQWLEVIIFGVVKVCAGIARQKPRVVRRGREHIANTQVASLYALIPWQPLRREQGSVAGEQDRLVDGYDVTVGDSGHVDCPAPTDVARVVAREQVGRDEFSLSDDL